MPTFNNTCTIKRRNSEISRKLSESSLHPFLKRLLSNRDVQDPNQFDYSLEKLLDFSSLKDIKKATDIISNAVVEQKKIIIIGDFDADGATSTAVVIRALRSFGTSNVDYLVPNRFDFGYGLTPEIVEVAAKANPDIIITVDNGISSIDGVDTANKNNIKVVITDHHLPGKTLPDAAAIVNPNQNGCDFASKAIAGVGVAFYLMLSIRAELRQQGHFTDNNEPNMANLLDLVALGTVADVVPLDMNNRILVDKGLQRIRSGNAKAGIQALLKISGKDYRNCSSSDLGFYVGPRLNAAGRLDDMSAGIECLLTDDANIATNIATELNDLNHKRKLIEGEMLTQALKSLDDVFSSISQQPIAAGICIFHDKWHQGVIGLLASRIKEKFHRPVAAFANAGQNEIKGSCRSIPGLNIRDIIDTVAVKNPELVVKYGGHAMAAGLSLHKGNFGEFKKAFEYEVDQRLSSEHLKNIIETDGSVEPENMTLEIAKLLDDSGPWGQAFPEPMFDDEFKVVNWKVVGDKHLKMQLKQIMGDKSIDAIAFNFPANNLPTTDKIRAAYKMTINDFRDIKNLQLIVNHIEPVDS